MLGESKEEGVLVDTLVIDSCAEVELLKIAVNEGFAVDTPVNKGDIETIEDVENDGIIVVDVIIEGVANVEILTSPVFEVTAVLEMVTIFEALDTNEALAPVLALPCTVPLLIVDGVDSIDGDE